MNKLKLVLAAAAAALSLSAPSNAAVISLNFEGVNATHPSGYAFVEEFYNGGTSSDGTSGTNYGISFGANAQAICLNTLTATCSNTSRGGLGDPGSQLGALFFLAGSETFMNVAAGFATGFAFNYVSVSFAGAVNVFDGLNGTGNLLATLNLTPNAGSCPGYSAGFCPFSPTGVLFSGIAKSVGFGGVANQIVFDDITFGTDIPGPAPIPVPATLPLLLVGLGGMGLLRRARRT